MNESKARIRQRALDTETQARARRNLIDRLTALLPDEFSYDAVYPDCGTCGTAALVRLNVKQEDGLLPIIRALRPLPLVLVGDYSPEFRPLAFHRMAEYPPGKQPTETLVFPVRCDARFSNDDSRTLIQAEARWFATLSGIGIVVAVDLLCEGSPFFFRRPDTKRIRWANTNQTTLYWPWEVSLAEFFNKES